MATTLLQLALMLLIAAQGPNVPQDLKDRAISVANTAIVQANIELKAAPQVAKTAPIVPTCTLSVTVSEVSSTTPGMDTATWSSNATAGTLYRVKSTGGANIFYVDGVEYRGTFDSNIKFALTDTGIMTHLSHAEFWKATFNNGTTCYAKTR